MLTRATFLALFAISFVCATITAHASSYPSPYILSYSPTSGAPGTVITVYGSGFSGLRAAWIGNGRDATLYVVSSSVLKVTVPKDATTGKLALFNPTKAAWSPGAFTLTGAAVAAVKAVPASVSLSSTGSSEVFGDVSGASNVSVQLTGTTTHFATTNSSGVYAFTGVANGTYTLAPDHPGYVFSPSSLAETVTGGSVSGVNFVAQPTTSPTYSITGAVSGAVAANVIITLNGTNVGSAATDQGGSYGFFGLTSGTYTVSASLPGYAFSQSRTVTIGTVDSTANNFTSTLSNGSLSVSATNPMSEATVGTPYAKSVWSSTSGGKAPYHYQSGTLSSGTPPWGMSVNSSGVLTGTPKLAGKYYFTICATDSQGHTTSSCPRTWITVAQSSAKVTPVTTTPAPTLTATPTPTPTPSPAPTSGTSWVYYNGSYDWPLDYSYDVNVDYADTSGAPVSGGHDIKVSLTSAWGGWLPVAKNWDFNSAPYTKLTFALKPTVANQKWNVYFVRVGDVPVGIYIDPTQYGPAPVVGQWATYTIPLSVLGVQGDPIYKFCIHDETGLGSNTWYVDNVGFAP